MDVTETQPPLRSRLIARGAIEPPLSTAATSLGDPFAGEDELWADEDWAYTSTIEVDEPHRFFARLVLALSLSALAWLGLAAVALVVYRILA